ncbi:hypothetical protein [Dactylosporangium sp. CA-233914]|uniref:hypothetical protein n=1 Tax=Dactylosporangium sp. CA-233914 TaxID=3239934 RepID=UPI003D9362DF
MTMGERLSITRKTAKRIAKVSLVVGLAGMAGLTVGGPAWSSGQTSPTHNCYTIWWSRDWNQECNSPGAEYAGSYTSTVDCSSPQVNDRNTTWYRIVGSRESYDGEDCVFGINTAYIRFR